jgi:tetratricopeptide (TPR) repeat protein
MGGMNFLGMHFFILFLFCWALFSNGLYFSVDLYPISLVIGIVFLLYIVYGFISGRKQNTSGQLLFSIPLLYALTLIFHVESTGGTIKRIILWVFLGGYFYFLHISSKGKEGTRKLINVTYLFCTILLISSFFVLSRIIEVPSFILKPSGLGERLGGFLQYPNVFAAVIGSLMMFILITVKEDDNNRAVMLLPGLFSLLLMTESRGALLCLIITWILSFFFMKEELLLTYLFYSFTSLILGLCLYLLVTKNGTILENEMNVMELLIVTCMMWGLTKIPLKITLPNWSKIWHIPVFISMLLLLTVIDIYYKGMFYHFFPNSLRDRLYSGTGTLSDRMVYWKDAWQHIHEFIWTGLGGEGWKFLMYRVQTAPYLTSEIHNSYLNILLELGIFSFTLIIFGFGWILYKMVRTKSVFYIPLLFLLLHGMIDFTFSYGLSIMLVLLYISLFLSEEIYGVNWKNGYSKIVITTISCALVTVCLFLSIRFIQADNFAAQEDSYESLQEAIRLNPWNSAYRIQDLKYKNGIEGREKILKEGLKYESHHAYLLFEYANVLHEKGEIKKSISYYKYSIKFDRYDTRKYEAFMEQMDTDVTAAIKKGTSATLYKKEAINAYKKAIYMEKVRNKSIVNQRKFSITDKMDEIYNRLINL